MNILITGANGFLGSYLVKSLLDSNNQVFALVRKEARLKRIEGLTNHLNYKLLFIDENLKSVIQTYGIDLIIHTATDYGRKNSNFVDMVAANELFPLSLLQDLPANRKVTFINTDSSLPALVNSYAVSKSNFVLWGKYLASINKLQFINLKLEHFYGYGDDDSKFTAYIIKSMLERVTSIDLTMGEQLRDFIYINDVVAAYMVIIGKLECLQDNFIEFAIGSGKVISIRELVLLIKELTDNTITKLNFGKIPYRENELMLSKADIGGLVKLGWQPNFTLKEGLTQYIKECLL